MLCSPDAGTGTAEQLHLMSVYTTSRHENLLAPPGLPAPCASSSNPEPVGLVPTGRLTDGAIAVVFVRPDHRTHPDTARLPGCTNYAPRPGAQSTPTRAGRADGSSFPNRGPCAPRRIVNTYAYPSCLGANPTGKLTDSDIAVSGRSAFSHADVDCGRNTE